MNHDRAAEMFGLADDFPLPGWKILDAARGHLFTGELLFDLDPPVSVHLDRGEIYLAERSNEPPLGARLIDAGALNAEQLEHGSMQVGDTAHLGRLFDRVPSIDREFVTLMTEMMNDECVAWLATQEVTAVIATPYRRHSSGIHRWSLMAASDELRPGDPLPAPASTAAPVDFDAVQPGGEHDADSIVSWGQPRTDSPLANEPPESAETPTPPLAPPSVDTGAVADLAPSPTDSILGSDWADRLETHGLPDVDSDPLAVPTPLPPLPTGQTDRFELIWPSGEIDDDFDAGAALASQHERDQDRAGPTARVVRSADVAQPDTRDDDTIELWDFETSGPSFGPVEERPEQTAPVAPETTPTPEADRHLTVITDDAVLSMRRAVETIEAESTVGGSVRHADASTTTDAIRDGELVLPGRVATRTESSVWSVRGFENSTNRSVFDETVPAAPVAPPPSGQAHEPATVTPLIPATAGAPADNAEPGRVSALRRLIGGLRRR